MSTHTALIGSLGNGRYTATQFVRSDILAYEPFSTDLSSELKAPMPIFLLLLCLPGRYLEAAFVPFDRQMYARQQDGCRLDILQSDSLYSSIRCTKLARHSTTFAQRENLASK